MANYKCNSCGSKFGQDDFSTNCPYCQSDKVVKDASGIGLFLKKHWIKLSLIVLLLITMGVAYLFLGDGAINYNGGGHNKDKNAFEPSFEVFDNGVEIVFYQHDLDGNMNSESKIKIQNLSMAKILANAYQFRVQDSKGNSLALHDNKFYPCNENDNIYINWFNDSIYPLLNSNITSKQISFTLKTDPHKLACRTKLKILKVDPLPNCWLIVKTNYDDLPERANVMISINGKNGKYFRKNKFDASNLEKLNIWAVFDTDTVGFNEMNGNDFIGLDCYVEPPNPEKIKQIGDLYGSAPGNRNQASGFFSLQGINMHTIFFIDGVKMGKKSDIEIKLKVNHENDGAKYKIASGGIKIENNLVTEIRFITL